MKTTMLIIALLVSATAAAQETRPIRETRPTCNVNADPYALVHPCTPKTGAGLRMSNLGLELDAGQAIDYADIYTGPVGPVRGYVWVKVQGEWALVAYTKP